MQKIKQMLTNRLVGSASRVFFLECPVGQKIRILADQAASAQMYSVSEMPERRLLGLLGTLRRSMQESGEGYRAPLSLQERAQVEEEIYIRLHAQAAHDIAKEQPEGCLEYGECNKCPNGIEIMAREIWEYTTGGGRNLDL